MLSGRFLYPGIVVVTLRPILNSRPVSEVKPTMADPGGDGARGGGCEGGGEARRGGGGGARGGGGVREGGDGGVRGGRGDGEEVGRGGGGQGMGLHQCPSCLLDLGTTAALYLHMQTGGGRCLHAMGISFEVFRKQFRQKQMKIIKKEKVSPGGTWALFPIGCHSNQSIRNRAEKRTM